MGQRVKESRESERPAVIAGTGFERKRHHPRETGQTSTRSLIAREFDKPPKEERQMNVKVETPAACASPDNNEAWHQTNWQHCNETVRRLQARIVKATEEGRWNKVKSLQRLLTHSISAKKLAVRKVTENQGKYTAKVKP